MKVSLNTIKQFTQVDLTLDELTAKINSQLGAIDEVINVADKYKDAVIVKVVECEKHPAADRLSVTKIDDGGVVQDVERDEKGLVQVVCGAPNVQAGLFAVWLPPRSVVPATYSDDEPFVLGARELRGIMSQGMLAAADELGIGSSHDGILEIDPDEWKPNDVAIVPGVSFAAAYGLDDTIIDVENKMFTHRPDLFGQLGVAREIAGIQHKKFISPQWYIETPQFKTGKGLALTVGNEAEAQVPRLMAVALQDVEVKPSPLWLQCALVSMGSKPINNIVDVTNYIMLITAQPVHAYDYDKLRGNTLLSRMAADGETVELLNGKTYQLTSDDIVIADKEGPIGLAGIMGGANSEVSASTKNIVLEVANFDMYTLRKTSMRHGVFTDALTRFNKGQSSLQNSFIMQLLIKSVFDVSPGVQASDVYDYMSVSSLQPVTTTAVFINERLGLNVTKEEVQALLNNVEFTVDISGEHINVTAPFWRTDVELPEDIVEEVGRLYGFDRLPRVLPSRTTKPAIKNTLRETKKYVRETLRRAGANEVLTYSFIHQKIMERAGQDSRHAYRLTNALSPDLQYYRLSLTPSLLDKVHMNYKAGHHNFALFELGKTHFKGVMDASEPTVPNEDTQLAFVIASKRAQEGAAYYRALRYLKEVVDIEAYEFVELNSFDIGNDEWAMQLVSAYEPTRSAVIVNEGHVRGVIGEFKLGVRGAFKLPEATAGFEIHTDIMNTQQAIYQPLSKFPSVTQDISLKVPLDVSYQSIINIARAELKGSTQLVTKLSPVSIYQSVKNTDTKTVTVRLKVTSYQQTLQDADVTKILDAITQKANDALGAERV